jgi:predicted ATPase
MSTTLLNCLQLMGFLSFGRQSRPVRLTPLNVLIGPNGVGKSNFIGALELLHATPADFSAAIRQGGLPADWIWHGPNTSQAARIDARLSAVGKGPVLRYAIEFADSRGRLEIVDEVLEEAAKTDPRAEDVRFYCRFQHGRPAINMVVKQGVQRRQLRRETIDPQQSILSQKRDADLYPEVTATAVRFGQMRIFREWGFGRTATLRAPQPANLPVDALLPNLVNLGLVLNDLEHSPAWDRFNELLRRFLPRYKRLSTKVSAGAVQVFLHEDGVGAPVPATRLSDGTLRFLSLLAILLYPYLFTAFCQAETRAVARFGRGSWRLRGGGEGCRW